VHVPIGRSRLDYILPIKSASTRGDDALTAYLGQLRAVANVIVVDGSVEEVFAARAERWRGSVSHVRPHPEFRHLNGKVNGVRTGLRLGTAGKIIIADEDVRYDAAAVQRIDALLDTADLVIPQNYFQPMPWHAQWDTARSLLNRLTPSGDFPGTLALRRTDWLANAGYDGDVLFENLELIRTVRASGGTVRVAADLFVRRSPPDTAHFVGQRVRQAYDSQAQPVRLAAELAILPALAALARRPGTLAAAALACVALAEAGRRRASGRAVFPATATLYAPAWVLERGVCAWLALASRARGGVRYAGTRLRRAAHSELQIRRAVIAVHAGAEASGRVQPGDLVAAVAERLDR
jgi:hypothetical protein